MKVFIQGINSFIGSALAEHLYRKGWSVSGSSRSAQAKEKIRAYVTEYYQLDLESPLKPGIFTSCDAIVYCAHSHEFDSRTPNLNVSCQRSWYTAAKMQGIRKHLFLTSYSAKPHSRSAYGAAKYDLENFFVREKQWVVRPGLVMGAGGLVAAMTRLIKTLPLVPVIGAGRYRLPVIEIQTLCRAMGQILADSPPDTYNLFLPRLITMTQLLKKIKADSHSRCLLIPVPDWIPLLLLGISEKIGIRLPIKSESIRALRENQELTAKSHIPRLNLKLSQWEAQLADSVENPIN